MGHVLPKEARNKNIIAVPFKYLQMSARLSWAGSVAFSGRVAPEHKPSLGQAWEALELTETQISAQSLTSRPPRGGLPHWVCAPPWDNVGSDRASWQGDSSTRSGDPMTLRSVLSALDAFSWLCEV